MARFYLSSSFILGAVLIGDAFAQSPTYSDKFSVALPIPPVLDVLTSLNLTDRNPIDFYELTIKPFTKQLWPGLNETQLVGYNGINPGPTIIQPRGRESLVRFINQGDAQAAIHLHGSATVAPFDGWASDLIDVGEYKDYYYPNFQEGRTLWYHDHAHEITTSNVAKGQAGFYIINDQVKEDSLQLPMGNYDIPLAISSKRYTADGQVTILGGLGDTIEVNGQLYPFLNVEPRKYRFRLLNAAATRTFTLQLHQGNDTSDPQEFQVIASDSGYMESPVSTTTLKLAMGERYEAVIDFEQYMGTNLTLRNSDAGLIESDTLGQILRFVVGTTISDDTNNEGPPSHLRDIEFLPIPVTPEKSFMFELNTTTGKFTINGVVFSDVANRVLNYVPRGTTEVWSLTNAAPGTHPVHIHLVEFQILSRTISGVEQALPAYEAAALKDIANLNAGETIHVLAKYAPWDGLYMFHCHNLVHSDNEMMAVFNVTELSDFGYPETTRFVDPEDERWAATEYNGTDLEQIRTVTLPAFKALNAYDDIDGLLAALDEYHEARATTTAPANATAT